jgi:hypothetical protein
VFNTVQEFVLEMTVGEGAQLYAMARFIVTNDLQLALRKLDWTAFARGYNGSGYAKNGYHTKLADAYAKRPAAEKTTPPPSSMDQLNSLIATTSAKPSPSLEPVAPAPPAPAPQPQPDDPGPTGAEDAQVGNPGLLARFFRWLLGL